MSDGSSCIKGVREVEGTVVVSLVGEIDMHHTPEAHRTLTLACNKQPPRLVVNLGEVTYMDSSGLGVLVEVLRKVKSYNGLLRICCMTERVQSVFEITRLDHFFEIAPTEEEALVS